VQPDGSQTLASPPPIERERFEGLLAKIRSGAIGSGRSVRLPEDGSIELDDELMSRLSEATDAAHAAGASRLLALVDEHVLRVDVAQREAQRAEDAVDGGLMTGFDAAVVISREPEDAPRVIERPGDLRNASLGEMLARVVRSGQDAAPSSRVAG